MQCRNGRAISILLEDCDCACLRSRKWCEKTVMNIAEWIGMRPIISPVSRELTAEEVERAEDSGISAFVLIAESHIALHTWPHYNSVRIAVDSCKDFNLESFENVLKVYFGTHKLSYIGKGGICLCQNNCQQQK